MSAPVEPRWGLGPVWAALVERALAPTGGEESILEALALASAVALVPGGLDALPAGARRRLVARGAALLLSSAPPRDDSDEALARGRVLALARDGLDALRGTADDREPAKVPGTRARSGAGAAIEPTRREPAEAVAPATLRRLLEGKLDGFAAAELARRLRPSAAARVELELLASHPPHAEAEAGGAARPRLRLVADDAPSLRDPAAGRTVGVGRSGAVELEAVRFDDGVVAIYAAPPRRIAVPVMPPGVKLVRTALGYVELDVRKTRAKEVDVAVGSLRVPLSIR